MRWVRSLWASCNGRDVFVVKGAPLAARLEATRARPKPGAAPNEGTPFPRQRAIVHLPTIAKESHLAGSPSRRIT